jgi:Ni,Fe-hydrogenase III component G
MLSALSAFVTRTPNSSLIRLRGGVTPNNYALFIGLAGLAQVALYLRLAASAYKVWLVEIVAYSLATILGLGSSRTLLCYMFGFGAATRLTVFTCATGKQAVPSLDLCFRNARWLEREVSEMHDLFFSNKRDRRALFLLPMLF